MNDAPLPTFTIRQNDLAILAAEGRIGDYPVAVRTAREVISGGFAKLTKLGQGFLDLHSGRSQVDFEWLSAVIARAVRPAGPIGRIGCSIRSGASVAPRRRHHR